MTEPPILPALETLIAGRKAGPTAEPSYVADLLRKGPSKILGKIVEEASELIEAGAESGDDGQAHRTREAADLVFHVLVLLGHAGVELADVEAELGRRFGIGGHVEKAARGTAGGRAES